MKEYIEKRSLTGNIKLNLTGRGLWEAKKEDIVFAINNVVNAYQRQGYTLTLRQLYYQLVAKDYIPNHDTVYKKLSSILDDCRYAGKVDWNAIEDRGRIPYKPSSFQDIPELLRAAKNSYALDGMLGQPKHIELWTEKDAISGILKQVASPYHVRIVVNKGYTSSTAAYNAYKRFATALEEGKEVIVLYFGDHDPSGLDMVRDIRDRCLNFLINGNRLSDMEDGLTAWAKRLGLTYEYDGTEYADDSEVEDYCREEEWFEKCYVAENDDYPDDKFFHTKMAYVYANFKVIPIGLTMEQIKAYNPPPNPAKITDPRARWYISQYGQKSWEVDALSPTQLNEIVTAHIEENMDMEKYYEVKSREDSETKQLEVLIDSLSPDDKE